METVPLDILDIDGFRGRGERRRAGSLFCPTENFSILTLTPLLALNTFFQFVIKLP